MTSSYAYPQPHGRSSRRVWNLIAALSLATSAWWTAQGQPPTVEAAGTISGAAFLDYNQDGLNNTSAGVGLPAVDQGVAGVQVRAYDSAGAPQGNATTGADGTYALVTTGIGPYRVEFTLPAGYLPSGEGADNGTTVQFVPNGGGTANLGLTIPSQYCQNNPLQCTPRFVNGQASTGSLVGNTEGLVAFPEDSTSATGAGMITTTLASNIGATWGVAWQRSSNSLFAGALAKRYTSFGPGGSDAIYKITVDPDTGVASATSVFVNLTTLTGGPADTGTITGRDLVNNSFGTPSYDADAFAKTGKIALGDLELSDDGNTLYVVSLTDRTLYALAIGPTGTAPTSTVGTPITLPAGATACAAADLRPWALEVQGASVFVGVVCSAESSANRANLRAYVLELNGSAFDLVAEFPLSYPRGCATNESSTCFPAEWQPWRDTASTVCGDGGSCVQPYGKQIIYPQPILADIEVDRDGALVLGLMDRSGHQWGNNNYGPTSAGTNLTVSFINSATGAVNSTTSLTAT
ncbi:MAG: hypothetical protein JNL73_23330, partial [Anaerolineales bacterium]|nr:hypothetical protein [Anaerolineales bacterium]